MNNFLAGTRVYLAGPVEWAGAAAFSWREMATKRLTPLGVTVYDPLVKPTWLRSDCKMDPAIYRQVLDGKSTSMTQQQVFDANETLRILCMKMVSSADWIICNLPKAVTVGTHGELHKAFELDKPVLFHAPDGMFTTWYPPMFSTAAKRDTVWFKDWDALFGYVSKLDSGAEEMDPVKWFPVTYPPAISR